MPDRPAPTFAAMATALDFSCRSTAEYQKYGGTYGEQFQVGSQLAIEFAAQNIDLFCPLYGSDKSRRKQAKQAAKALSRHLNDTIQPPAGEGFGHAMWVGFIWPIILSAIISALVRKLIDWLFFSGEDFSAYKTLQSLAQESARETRNAT